MNLNSIHFIIIIVTTIYDKYYNLFPPLNFTNFLICFLLDLILPNSINHQLKLNPSFLDLILY